MRKQTSKPRRPEDEMSTLLLIIPSVWITTVAMVVLLCRGAARGDRAIYEQREARRGQYDDWSPEGSHIPCERRERRLAAAPVRDRDGRARGGRCAAGS